MKNHTTNQWHKFGNESEKGKEKRMCGGNDCVCVCVKNNQMILLHSEQDRVKWQEVLVLEKQETNSPHSIPFYSHIWEHLKEFVLLFFDNIHLYNNKQTIFLSIHNKINFSYLFVIFFEHHIRRRLFFLFVLFFGFCHFWMRGYQRCCCGCCCGCTKGSPFFWKIWR